SVSLISLTVCRAWRYIPSVMYPSAAPSSLSRRLRIFSSIACRLRRSSRCPSPPHQSRSAGDADPVRKRDSHYPTCGPDFSSAARSALAFARSRFNAAVEFRGQGAGMTTSLFLARNSNDVAAWASPVVAVPPVHHEDGLHSITPLGISSPVSRG